MIIGFDGKRAFQNKTGLGNYSRSLVANLSAEYVDNRYLLFAPKQTNLFNIDDYENIAVHTPHQFFYKKMPGLWRRQGMVKDIAAAGATIFHGLSNELPAGLKHSRVKTVVTIHDLIFEHFPTTYNFDERYIHRWKIVQACNVADCIVAISNQTKNDLINLYKVPPEKIVICYQACNPLFEKIVIAEEKLIVKKRYLLPDRYLLFVSSITARKNLIAICKAMVLLKNTLALPLVIIGDGKKEKDEATAFMHKNDMEQCLIFLNDMAVAKEDAFTSAADFPAIYQQAVALIYPSLFEGFGLPVLEAMWSGLPVICSNTSSLPEVGGDAIEYFEPHDYTTLAKHILRVASDTKLAASLKARGIAQAGKFSSKQHAKCIMEVYKNIY